MTLSLLTKHLSNVLSTHLYLQTLRCYINLVLLFLLLLLKKLCHVLVYLVTKKNDQLMKHHRRSVFIMTTTIRARQSVFMHHFNTSINPPEDLGTVIVVLWWGFHKTEAVDITDIGLAIRSQQIKAADVLL